MSNQPPPYSRQFNFEDYQSLNPTAPLPGEKVEAELNGARASINQTISRLNEIQNADGSLKTPDALEAETTATATAVATATANSATQTYLAANYDPNVATDAAASAAAALVSKNAAQNAEFLALTHANYAEQATLSAQNYAGQAATSRTQALNHATAANTSKIETAALAAAVESDFNEVAAVYAASLSLKNWVDSESFQFLHKREDMSDAGAIMMFNDGEAENTLIDKIFTGASVNPNSAVVYRPPTSDTSVGNVDIFSGPWWVEGHDSPEDPHKIVMRDMMSCLVDTWLTFGPRVGPWSGGIGNLKVRQNGINGAPQSSFHQGDEYIKGVNYSKDGFGIGIINGSDPLTPKGYVDAADLSLSGRIDGKANTVHTHTVGDVIGLQDAIDAAKLQAYDNFKIYTTNDLVLANNKIFKFNNYVGAAGYGPITHPTYWTEQSAQPDLTPYITTNAATAQFVGKGQPGSVPATGISGQVLTKLGSSPSACTWEWLPAQSTTWGNITGELSSQLDLKTALDGKINLSGGSMTGKLNCGGLGSVSSLNIGASTSGYNPTTTYAGDVWISGPNLKLKDITGAIRTTANTDSVNTFNTNQIISASTSDPLLRITQTGTGNALVVEDSTNPDGTSFVINQSGAVGIGVTSVNGWLPSANAVLDINGNVVIKNGNLDLGVNSIAAQSITTVGTGTFGGLQATGNVNIANSTSYGSIVYIGSGALASGQQRNIYIGTEGLNGSTTLLYLGSANGNSSVQINANYGVYINGSITYSTSINSRRFIASPASNVAGLNIGIGGTDTASTTAGDVWIPTGSSYLNYRDGNGTWRNCLANNLPNALDVNTATQPAMRITQRGGAPVLVVEDSTTPDTSALVVDSNGNIGVGVASGYTATSKVDVVGNVKADSFSNNNSVSFSITAISSHSGGSDTHELTMVINGVTYRIPARAIAGII